MFVLVRHGHAGGKKSWSGPDAARPLSPAGHQQAEGLAQNLLALMRPAQLQASPFLRCQQTLAPLSQRSARVVTSSDLLAADASPAALDRHLSTTDTELAVYCTHGETLKGLFGIWLERGTIELMVDGQPATANRTEKGSAWLVLTEEKRVAHYLRPLHVGPPLFEPDDEPAPLAT